MSATGAKPELPGQVWVDSVAAATWTVRAAFVVLGLLGGGTIGLLGLSATGSSGVIMIVVGVAILLVAVVFAAGLDGPVLFADGARVGVTSRVFWRHTTRWMPRDRVHAVRSRPNPVLPMMELVDEEGRVGITVGLIWFREGVWREFAGRLGVPAVTQ